MSNPELSSANEYKKEQRAKHKASQERRNLRKNRHNVWIGEKEKD